MRHDHIVYVIDPDESIGDALSALLETYRIAVRNYPDAQSFLQDKRVKKGSSYCLLIETSLPDQSGLSLLRELRDRHYICPVIMLTDIASTEIRTQARRLGATDVLEKPLLSSFLLDRLKTIFPDRVADKLNGGNGIVR